MEYKIYLNKKSYQYIKDLMVDKKRLISTLL